jgi:hypothetical protein
MTFDPNEALVDRQTMNPYDHRTNESLVELLRKIAADVRSFTPADRAQIIEAAAKRLDEKGGRT